MAAMGAPIVGDDLYPQLCRVAPDEVEAPLQLLAQRLAFEDPLTGEHRQFDSARQLEQHLR